jgi:hypothetical protein
MVIYLLIASQPYIIVSQTFPKIGFEHESYSFQQILYNVHVPSTPRLSRFERSTLVVPMYVSIL